MAQDREGSGGVDGEQWDVDEIEREKEEEEHRALEEGELLAANVTRRDYAWLKVTLGTTLKIFILRFTVVRRGNSLYAKREVTRLGEQLKVMLLVRPQQLKS